MRAMVMAAGLGTRLRPITHAIPKPVVPIGNVAIVEQLVRLLAAHGVDEVIANLHWFPDQVRGRLGDGSELGVRFSYAVQPSPDGLTQAFLIGEEFLDGDAAALVLGDNIFTAQASADASATCTTRRVATSSPPASLTPRRPGSSSSTTQGGRSRWRRSRTCA
ncbi:MAG TPA: sugar phosphate nucleotidyltransferase, partial [Solirubrobacterales bacterium]|nr:sugar phosphate nucleotidyltransferase [Solirubrobacterales bacterium]